MPEPDPPRLLHRRSHHGYTDRLDLALTGEPEAVPRREQERITAVVRRSEREAQTQEWERRRVGLQREIDWLYSQRFQRTVRSEVRVLQRQLDRIDRRLREPSLL